MIEDTNRNVRTLIVSFVVAIMALIPLRFMELGESALQVPEISHTQVLGESVEVEEEVTGLGLEAPYDEIENAAVINGL